MHETRVGFPNIYKYLTLIIVRDLAMEKQSGLKRFLKVFALIPLMLIFMAAAAVLSVPSPTGRLLDNQTVEFDENALFTYEISRYSSRVEISNNLSLGFSLDPWNLNFGIVPKGGNMGRRFLTLQNSEDIPAKVQLKSYGNISPMIEFSDNNFLLLKEAPQSITITLNTTKDTLPGNYSGEIDIIVKKPKYGFVKRLM